MAERDVLQAQDQAFRAYVQDAAHDGLAQADQPVVDAVRASMSIPFFYKPTRLTDAGGRDCWLVDGAMLSRFPSMRSTPRPAWSHAGRRSASSCDGTG